MSPLKVDCPVCGTPAGEACTTEGESQWCHRERVDAAKSAADEASSPAGTSTNDQPPTRHLGA